MTCTSAAGTGTMASSQPLLAVENVSAFYGTAQALEDVSFEIAGGATAMVGRNGMGKTTLCNAIVGIPPARVTGSIRYRGIDLVGKPSYKIAKLGIGYVPQGRRLFPSLTVDEHLRMLAGRGRSDKRWTVARIYELFPRLAERRRNGGAQLSGGEQQMLAIGRALITNPELLIMDEPSEGLAPAIIEQLIETFRTLEQEGLAILLIEQNLGMATAIAERQLVMVAGSIATETTAAAALDRYGAATPLPRRRAARGAHVMATVVLVGTLDTKGVEYAFLRERLFERGVDVVVVDAGVHEPVGLDADVSREEVARAVGADTGGAGGCGRPRRGGHCDGRRRRGGRARVARARAASTGSSRSAAPVARRSRPGRCALCRSACRSCSSQPWRRVTRVRTSVRST